MLSTTTFPKSPSLISLPKPFLSINDQTHAHFRRSDTPHRPYVRGYFRRNQILCEAIATRTRRARNNGATISTTISTGNGVRPSTIIPPETKTTVKVTATIAVKLNESSLRRIAEDWWGQTLQLELVSAELNPIDRTEKARIKGENVKSVRNEGEMTIYEAKFEIPSSFGEIGAVLVEQKHKYEMYLADIVLKGYPLGPIRFACNSWVQPKETRIFFTSKSYLPSQTPSGLNNLRQEELKNLRGDGQGERKSSDRIYDYDTYDDLGDPDEDPHLQRPVLGGSKARPYPRRCRTGRPRCDTDKSSEKRAEGRGNVYVPRDEQFSEVKDSGFRADTLSAMAHTLLPQLEAKLEDPNVGFPFFTAIDSLFDQGIFLPGIESVISHVLPQRLCRFIKAAESYIRFDRPAQFERDRFSWISDEEFSRQTLAGANPLAIKLVKEWPLKSELDPEIYGPPESAITTELIREMIHSMTVEEAVDQKRLFMLDYHDALLPYVGKVRELKGATLYGSRTLFFLTNNGTLRPLAIELTRPSCDWKPQWKRVFSPSKDATSCWLWRLAKTHVLAHDSAYHQLISHWLRTHCCTEPYIIATNRQLSAMHPIYRLLHPYFRYTMAINARAREILINAGGIIESTLSLGKYSMELSSVIYDKEWRFDHQALPLDLINRGMAIPDPSNPDEILELTIKDYPYANDGLDLWDAMKEWVSNYVNHYYPNPSLVETDIELQSWWEEIRTVGHGDKKDEPWWPTLNSTKNLVQVLTTIIWVTSGHHAAVNFGQYAYGGYFPNRPPIARAKMPNEDPSNEEWKLFTEKPESVFLQCLPSQVQATKVMAILDVLSAHSIDEEYIGQKAEPSWEGEPIIKVAFDKFHRKLMELDLNIDQRNNDRKLKNRNGVGIVPYELLKPVSEYGVTGKGVPNSISI